MQQNVPELSKYFTPTQPTVGRDKEEIKYQEFSPNPLNANFIYCFWQLKARKALLTPYTYHVVADGCIDIFFDISDPTDSWIVGIAESHIEFDLAKEFNYFGIRFFPSMFPQLFAVDAEKLANQFQQLSHIQNHITHYISNSIPAKSQVEVIIDRMNQYFQLLINASHLDYDARFYDALLAILKYGGCYEIEKLNTGISPRQLRRLFKYYIGVSPKAFSKIVRFQHILHAKPSHRGLQQNELFFHDGYFDQPHFIREFKAYYGKTPNQAKKDWL